MSTTGAISQRLIDAFLQAVADVRQQAKERRPEPLTASVTVHDVYDITYEITITVR